jgi:BNR repeat-like domain
MIKHWALIVLAMSALSAKAAAPDAPAAHHGSGMNRTLAMGATYAPDGTLYLVGLDASGHLILRSSRDRGQHFTDDLRLDTGDDVVVADGEGRPEIAVSANGTIIVTYVKPLPRQYTGEVRYLRSTDHGKTFSAPQTLHDDHQEITHRFASMAFDGHGDLVVVWVDKRDAERERHDGHAYTGAAIYAKRSHDAGATWEADRAVAPHSCECCRIALAQAPDGDLVAFWRHVFDGNVRDHAWRRLTEANDTPLVQATHDQWTLQACPHHGPSLVTAAGGGYHAVWFGWDGQQSHVRYGRLSDQGELIGEARNVDDAAAEHAAIGRVNQRVALVWKAYDAGQTHLRAMLSDDDGAHYVVRELAATTGASDEPRLASSPNALDVIWRTDEGVQIHALDR